MASDNSNAPNVLTLANEAFRALETSSKLDGKGRQLLAYCVTIQHGDDVATDLRPPSLSAMKESPKAARTYMSTLAKAFVGVTANEQRKGEAERGMKPRSDDHWNALDKQYRARFQHLTRAVQLAADLQSANVDVASFDQKAGMFRVAPSVICDHNAEPIGTLAKVKSVLLDGSPWLVELGGKIVSINASLSRVTDAARSKRVAAIVAANPPTTETPPNGASATTTTGGAPAAAIVTKLETFSFDALIVRAGAIANEPSDGPVRRSMMTDEAWNALGDLVAFYNEIEKNEANAVTEAATVTKAA